ncbi:GntR family transcriptional regulator [Nocardioides taihuensis]|uniref:GntR family transcriptional regulator n=1 Tax=Nocardioides taihuensis TaxID=1835606 RepID=A0ABW0BFD2_9ACTN
MEVHPLDPSSDQPPYEQLRRQIASRASSGGDLAPGTRLPTVRGLAAELGLAVNTVAKSYRALEHDGVIVTRGRGGTFVASAPEAGSADAEQAAAAYAATARRLGLGLDDATRLLERSW